MSSVIINPVMYGFLNENFKQRFYSLVKNNTCFQHLFVSITEDITVPPEDCFPQRAERQLISVRYIKGSQDDDEDNRSVIILNRTVNHLQSNSYLL